MFIVRQVRSATSENYTLLEEYLYHSQEILTMATALAPVDTSTATAANAATSPRKRRRRAPTTGAADDCFACQDRHTSCDRRRPYCTQCLDRGKDCSGYKTTLTWGVGVASRGKLRGLALPIPKSKKVAPVEDSKTSKKNNSNTSAQSKSRNNTADGVKKKPSGDAFTAHRFANQTPMSTTFGFVNVSDPSAPTPSPVLPPPNYSWPQPIPAQRRSTLREPQRPNLKRALRRHSLEPLHVPALQIADYGNAPMTAHVYGGYGEHQYDGSMDCSPLAPVFHGYEGAMPIYKGLSAPGMVSSPMEGSFHTGTDVGSWPSETMSSSISSNNSSRVYREDEGFFADPVVAHTLDHLLIGQTISDGREADLLSEEVIVDDEIDQDEVLLPNMQVNGEDIDNSLALSRSIPTLTIGKTPGLRFLINYYDKVISPVIVAFDGPTNPYRSHILRLATESDTLQHAIAALSASNLRMRREHNQSVANQPKLSLLDTPHENSVRKSSIAHNLLNDDLNCALDSSTSPGTPSQEELHHKGESIRALNAQLADPVRRKDDSILATLLVLCLYHICDTGVAKFKTQFAGVKKILALRGDIGTNSKETNWLTTMFKWFDAMTATVNDREGQFSGDDCDDPIFDNEEWALENLAGCDGRLFQTISKLGRLNLLSQNKPVTNPSPNTTPKPRPQPLPRTQEYYSMNYNRFDGNGWSTLLDKEDMSSGQTDSRTQFWTEWSDIRKQLLDWQLDVSSLSAPMCAKSLEVNRKDLGHISESFRYSALLYTERLAYPHLPSAHVNFQNLVSQALYHIANVKSDVFLLWPLFITGTECVQKEHRALIHGRCLDIQKDSGFFNNISGLELLEKIWTNSAKDERDREAMMGGQSFKWRKAMETVDGEYIVI